MNKNKSKKSYILYAFHVPVLVLIGLLAVGSYFSINKITKNSEDQTLVLGKKSDKGNKTNPGQAKKADKVTGNAGGNNGSSNAAIHRKNVNNVVENLEAILEDEEELGNEELVSEILDIVNDESEDVTDVTEAIAEVEGRPAWKTALLGSDYKNLGQLRSSLVKNRNRIKKLTKSANKVQGEDNQLMYQEQLQVLNEEKESTMFNICMHMRAGTLCSHDTLGISAISRTTCKKSLNRSMHASFESP